MKTKSIILLGVAIVLYIIPDFLLGQSNSRQSTYEINITKNSFNDRYPSYSPDEGTILFESDRNGNWDIFIMDIDGTNQRALTNMESNERHASWSPDGKSIILESDKTGTIELYEFNVDKKKFFKFETPLDGRPSFPKYSPNGKYIAYSLSVTDTSASIIIADRKGKIQWQLLNDGFRSFYPNWSADSKSIVFFSRHETNNTDDEVYTFDLITSEMHRLTKSPKHDFCPAYSQDGAKIALVSSMDGIRPEIFVMNSNTLERQRVTNNLDGDTEPFWSSDNKKLLITGYREGNFEILELTLDNTY